ncbi:MAG: phosphoribosyltransferase [Promethearchaeota archaeon]|nr:MAG: phosphoribosyltransferase [Candidatus Lokiarchaeota archaeon]
MQFHKYKSRFQAGEILTEFIKNVNSALESHIKSNPNQYFCFAIPNGGVPVTEGFCTRFKLNYDILIVRKIKIPYNTEAGFGSVTTDGTILINEPLLSQLNLSEQTVNNSIGLTNKEIKERLKFYNKEIDLERFYLRYIKDRNIFILDDGLASGFTMLAAINMIRKYDAKKIFVAIPTAPLRSVSLVKSKIDELFCPNIRKVMWFAVADAYSNWYDVPESEVLEIINNSEYYCSKNDE